ncbi:MULTISPECIES: hypothetical protein [unclassified Mycolicibacterium]|nr:MULTISPECIES: hypothetical protein [unclassified Mycolicibacterium]
MSTTHKVERVVERIAAAVTRREPDAQAYPAEKERLVTQQELALLGR